MLRNLHRLAAAALLIIFSGLAAGQDGYALKRSLEIEKAGWAKIVVTDDMYEHLRPGLPDIRIYAGEPADEIPYVLRKPERVRDVKVEFRVINRTVSGKRRYFTFECKEEKTVNRIELEFKRRNYDRRVLLEGSNDQVSWQTVLEDYRIVSISNELTDFSFGTLRFPDLSYRFFRVSFESEDDPGDLTATVSRTVEDPNAVRLVRVSSFSVEEDDAEKRSVVTVNLERRVPVSAVRLAGGPGKDYYRDLEIAYRSGQDGEGRDLYREASKGMLSSFDNTPHRFPDVLTDQLRLSVRNGDSPPLTFSEPEVYGPRYALVANFPAAGTYFLLYSDPEAAPPDYDLAPFAARAGTELAAVIPGPETATGKGQGEAGELESGWWLFPVMVAVVLLMLVFAYRLIRNPR